MKHILREIECRRLFLYSVELIEQIRTCAVRKTVRKKKYYLVTANRKEGKQWYYYRLWLRTKEAKYLRKSIERKNMITFKLDSKPKQLIHLLKKRYEVFDSKPSINALGSKPS